MMPDDCEEDSTKGAGSLLKSFAKQRNDRYQREIAERVCIRTGDRVLQSMHLGKGCVKVAAWMQSKLIFYNLLATYLLLNMKDKRTVQTFSTTAPPIPYP